MTKDVDVVEIRGARLLDVAVQLFGKERLGRAGGQLYLESVSTGLPPLPGDFAKWCVEVPGP
jgi:hypothetical protein